MARLLCIVLFLCCSALSVSAVTAWPEPIVVRQPDGTTLTLRIVGDEAHHSFVSLDGCPMLRDTSTGFWRKATTDEQQQLTDAHHAARLRAARQQQRWMQHRAMPVTGRPRSLVVLVEYTDVHFSIPSPLQTFQRMLSEEGFADYGLKGSARDYFRDASNGRFDPQFEVLGLVQLKHDMAYYGGHDAQNVNDGRAWEMAYEACLQLDDDVNFNDYDTDGDGRIDNVFVIFAGRGEASGGGENSVWPHSLDLSVTPQPEYRFDGVRLDHYACTNELLGTDIAGIGTFCHEFCHVLGLPDLYSTDYNTAFSPGPWSILDSGSYNDRGKCPPTFSAYERYALGWTEPRRFDGPANVVLSPILDGGDVYLIPTAKGSEYFLIENRQQHGWDTFLPHHGMLVWHIDYDETAWMQNTVNNLPTHQRVDIVEADNLRTTTSLEGDPFPGTSLVRQLTDTTTPALVAWNGKSLGTSLTAISESLSLSGETEGAGADILFKVNGGVQTLSSPIVDEPSDVASRSFTAHWRSADAADVDAAYRFTLFELQDDGSLVPHPRYNALDVGSATSLDVHHLHPATHYAYSVTAFDAFDETSPSNLIDVTTHDLSFAEAAPTALAPTEITDESFVAQWVPLTEFSPLEGGQAEKLDGYTLQLFLRSLVDADETTMDFSDGVAALPDGWMTDCTATYSSAAYSGDAIPALRLSAGRFIATPRSEAPIRSVSFWHRSSAAHATLIIEGQDYDGRWSPISTILSAHVDGGCMTALTDADSLANDIYALRFSLADGETSSLALDDINVVSGGLYERNEISSVSLSPTSDAPQQHCFTGLTPATTYYYRVAATSATQQSAWSSDRSATTLLPAGLLPPTTSEAPDALLFDLSGHRVSSPHKGSIIITPHHKILND